MTTVAPLVHRVKSWFDRFMANQLALRRLRIEFPTEAQLLRTISEDLESVLVDPPTLEDEYGLFAGYWSAYSKFAWLVVLETKDGRKALRESNMKTIRRILGNPRFAPSWSDREELVCQCLQNYVDAIDEFTSRLNYLDHCSIMAMASICDFELVCGTIAAAAKETLSPALRKQLRNQSQFNWLVLPPPDDLDLICALKAADGIARFESQSITVLDSRSSQIVAQDARSHPALYLRVDLQRAPTDIDAALAYFHAALRERLEEVHGVVNNAPGAEGFFKTAFFSFGFPPPVLFAQTSQVVPAALGTWCWDLHDSGAKVDEAIDSINTRLGRWGGLEKRHEKSIGNQRQIIESLIRGRTRTILDRAVTQQNQIRLGLRTEERKQH